jgi:quinol-cytochrome oxidoreductase complex cytochrome b subunit
MPKDPLHRPLSSEKGSAISTPTGKPRAVVIARVIGILFVAVGFMLGIHGLERPGSPMLPAALGMIATGLVAQVFALVKTCFVGSQGKE